MTKAPKRKRLPDPINPATEMLLYGPDYKLLNCAGCQELLSGYSQTQKNILVHDGKVPTSYPLPPFGHIHGRPYCRACMSTPKTVTI